jgi:molybdenum cofactor biosynthesis enzyme MoaA
MNTPSYDFANILFSGKCNARCPYCIGWKLGQKYPWNLDIFPPKNLENFMELIRKYVIKEIIFTGTDTDPLLYHYQKELLEILREKVQNTKVSVHTNWFLILRQLSTFHLYDKATLSLPSFDEAIFQSMMGTKQKVIDLERISKETDIPLKVSRIVNPENNTLAETEKYLEHIGKTRITRIAFRKLANDTSSWQKEEEILQKFELNAIQNIDETLFIQSEIWKSLFGASQKQNQNR